MMSRIAALPGFRFAQFGVWCWKIVEVVDGIDEIVGRVEFELEEFLVGNGVFCRGFVTDVIAMSVPAATGIGKVEHLVEVEIEVGFGKDAVVGVVRLRLRLRFRLRLRLR